MTDGRDVELWFVNGLNETGEYEDFVRRGAKLQPGMVNNLRWDRKWLSEDIPESILSEECLVEDTPNVRGRY